MSYIYMGNLLIKMAGKVEELFLTIGREKKEVILEKVGELDVLWQKIKKEILKTFA